MTIENLLKPRYKVIADYPNSIYSIGEIIECDAEEDCTLHKWPAIFKKLEWWEDRKPENMPEYVRCVKTPDQIIALGECFKVLWSELGGKAENGPWIFPYTNCYEPATQTEYESYINKQ